MAQRDTKFTYRDLDRDIDVVNSQIIYLVLMEESYIQKYIVFLQCSHFGMEQGLAGHISLHLSLVYTISTGPDECTSDQDGPEGVPSQRVRIKAEEKTVKHKN